MNKFLGVSKDQKMCWNPHVYSCEYHPPDSDESKHLHFNISVLVQLAVFPDLQLRLIFIQKWGKHLNSIDIISTGCGFSWHNQQLRQRLGFRTGCSSTFPCFTTVSTVRGGNRLQCIDLSLQNQAEHHGVLCFCFHVCCYVVLCFLFPLPPSALVLSCSCWAKPNGAKNKKPKQGTHHHRPSSL